MPWLNLASVNHQNSPLSQHIPSVLLLYAGVHSSICTYTIDNTHCLSLLRSDMLIFFIALGCRALRIPDVYSKQMSQVKLFLHFCCSLFYAGTNLTDFQFQSFPIGYYSRFD